MAGLATQPQPTTPTQAIAMGMQYGPNAGLALQRSQYLAEALHAMQTNGSQDIRTPAALGLNLLAQALLQHARTKADKEALSAYATDRSAFDHSLTAGTPADQNYQPPAAPAPAQPSPQASLPEQLAPNSSAAPAPPPAQASLADHLDGGPQISDADRLPIAQTVWGEARGEPPEGQRAVASVILNRMHHAGMSPADVVGAPHQFQGFNPQSQALRLDDPRLASVLANIGPVLDGSAPDPTGGADHFFNPSLASPSWGAGPGQMIGHQKFMAMNEGGAPPPGPAPVQVATNGPLPASAFGPAQPPAPQPAGAPGTPGPAAQGGPAPPATPTQAGGAPPLNYIAPQEWQAAAALLQDPRTHDEGVRALIQLKLKAASAMAPPDKMFWGPDGRAHPMPGAETQQLPGQSPSDAAQRDAMGNVSHSSIPGVQGALGENQVYTPNGVVNLPVQQKGTFRIPGAPGLYTTDARGQPMKVADDEYGPAQLAELRNQVLKSSQYTDFDASNSAWRSMLDLYKQNPNGMRAYALLDTFARTINPGAVARVGTIQAIQEARGLPDTIRAWVGNLKGDGPVPPDMARNLIAAAQPFVQAHYRAVKSLNDSNAGYAQRHQVNPADVTAPLEQPVPFVVQPPHDGRNDQGSPAPASAVVPGAPRLSPQQVEAAKAELRRRAASQGRAP